MKAVALDKLVKALDGKYNGLKFDVWKRTAQSVICMRHADISDILEWSPCPKPKLISPCPYSKRVRPSRAVTRSQAADETDTQSGKTPSPETAQNVQPDAGITPVDTAHLLPLSSGFSTLLTAKSVSWATNDNISNLKDFENWHRDNRIQFDLLLLNTSEAAASFLRKSKPNEVNLWMERQLGMIWSQPTKIPPDNVDVYYNSK